MKQPNLVPVVVCDVYDRNLNWAADMAKGQARKVRDFRDLLSDKSIDVVCIATPDHWHPYIMVEACKQHKYVYVEKPISVTVDEGVKMVEAARKYMRVAQAGTMQRSAKHFQEAVEIVRSGELGKIAFVRTWNYGNDKQEGYGNPPDGNAPAGLDWDMWLGPAPRRPFNANRFGVDPEDKYFSSFRWFWDYAGGMMTDWGVHLLDIVQMASNEEMPTTITSVGGKYWLTMIVKRRILCKSAMNTRAASSRYTRTATATGTHCSIMITAFCFMVRKGRCSSIAEGIASFPRRNRT